jgi:hypothetical protein
MALTGFEQQERKREARRRLAAQRNRAGRLRGRVVAGSLICFALLWGIVFAQMATGNDPVLGEKTRTVARARRHAAQTRAGPTSPAREAIETTETDEAESQLRTSTPVESETPTEFEAEPEYEAEALPEPEPELEPLTTSQS